MADVGEAEQFELRRSSRAEVSQGIAAIDHDRARAVEHRWRVAQNVADRNVNRAADVRGVVLVRRQCVHNLRVRRQHPEKFAMVNLTHCYRRIAASAARAVSTIISPLPGAIREVSTS